jgi:hypothetical protein
MELSSGHDELFQGPPRIRSFPGEKFSSRIRRSTLTGAKLANGARVVRWLGGTRAAIAKQWERSFWDWGDRQRLCHALEDLMRLGQTRYV